MKFKVGDKVVAFKNTVWRCNVMEVIKTSDDFITVYNEHERLGEGAFVESALVKTNPLIEIYYGIPFKIKEL